MVTDWDGLFTSVLFGTGSLIGLIVVVAIIIGLYLRWKETAIIAIPVCFLLGLEYLTNNLPYHFGIMILTASFIVLNIVKEKVN